MGEMSLPTHVPAGDFRMGYRESDGLNMSEPAVSGLKKLGS